MLVFVALSLLAIIGLSELDESNKYYDLSDYDYEYDDDSDYLETLSDDQLLDLLTDDEEWPRIRLRRIRIPRIRLPRVTSIACGPCQSAVNRLKQYARSRGCSYAIRAAGGLLRRCGPFRSLCASALRKACNYVIRLGTGVSSRTICQKVRLC